MWGGRWVPLGDSKQASATAESIAQLFRGQEERLGELMAGSGKRLLEALGISLADLALRAVANDEDTRVSLIGSLSSIVRADGNDVAKVRLLAEEIKESPDLLDEIQERRDRRETVRRNQSIGEQVEEFLREMLSESGLKVTRTGVGSDFEVTEDYIIDEREVLLAVEGARRSLLIEVKGTRAVPVRHGHWRTHRADLGGVLPLRGDERRPGYDYGRRRPRHRREGSRLQDRRSGADGRLGAG